MSNAQNKKNTTAKRTNPATSRAKKEAAPELSDEDARDLREALRAREEAERVGYYPWEWLKQETAK